MKARASAAWILFAILLPAGCSPAERYDVLSTFFDGVPLPPPEEGPSAPLQDSALITNQRERAIRGTHGPYGARMCNACHESIANNKLVAPREKLCVRCHDLELDARYVHGPLASGGCTVCHDPHSSRYRFLLVAEPETFCLHCHDREAVARVEAHHETDAHCTTCHDAHKSNKKFLLK
ncbi:MAG: cytochrome c3 family protein [bacterium]